MGERRGPSEQCALDHPGRHHQLCERGPLSRFGVEAGSDGALWGRLRASLLESLPFFPWNPGSSQKPLRGTKASVIRC